MNFNELNSLFTMRILINTPCISIPAGVSNHYLGLRPYFSEDVVYNQYYPRSFINKKTNVRFLQVFLRGLTLVFDLLKFIFLLLYYNKLNVLLNPSLGVTAMRRDALYLRVAKYMRCKVAIFIHGWENEYFEVIIRNPVKFTKTWNKADVFFVLAKEFKESLIQLGIQSPIYLTTTKVNDKMLEGVSENKQIIRIKNLLFLARVEKEKGIFETLEIVELLSKKYPDIILTVVGSGTALQGAMSYAQEHELANIVFTGPLSGDLLKNEFVKSDLYILPTHGEGMPTSVLEAMAFGLPVITRPVGGLVDFFENDKMGYMIESLKPEDYTEKIELLINDIDKANSISSYNIKYAKEHFMASKIAPTLENIIRQL